MIYIENIFVCMVGPLIIAALIIGDRYRIVFLFTAIGMGICLLAAYINTFFARFYGADGLSAAVEIAPVCEEILKLLPLLFYVLIFEPKLQSARSAVIAIGAGFALFENACYLTKNGSAALSYLFIRGFGVGAMHIVCGAIVGYGVVIVWRYPWFKIAGTFGLLCAAITFHAIYNLLVSVDSNIVQAIGYLLPILVALLGFLADSHLKHILITE